MSRSTVLATGGGRRSEMPSSAARRAPRIRGENLRWSVLACLLWALLGGCAEGSDDRGDREPAAAPPAPSVDLHPVHVGTAERLQAVSFADADTVWVSGLGGTVARTVDGGATWDARVVPGAQELQFRDVHAVSAEVAYLLAAGEGDRSRILKTVDGGETWREQWRNADPRGFLDCFDFWSETRGLAIGDAVDGKLQLLRTDDGETWHPFGGDTPEALPGEGAFAASGGCLVARQPATAWIGSGAGGAARLWITRDAGETWEVLSTPIHAATPTSGITALVLFDDQRALVAGGDVADPTSLGDRVALTDDGGRTWIPGGSPALQSALYGAAAVPELEGPTVLAVGPGGADLSRDGGRTWRHLGDDALWAVAFGPGGVGWAVGPDGRVVRVTVR